jgi:hypothetical protein
MTLSERMKFVFNESGDYGGNQGNLVNRFNRNNDFRVFMRELLDDRGMTDADIRQYLHGLRDHVDECNGRPCINERKKEPVCAIILGYNDVGCGYMATANLILVEFANKPNEFERIFGFPLYSVERDGSIRPSFEKLAISIYHHSERDCRDENIPVGQFPKYAIENYLIAHNVDITVNRRASFPGVEEIKSDLQNGPVPISLNPCFLPGPSGPKHPYGAHAVVITGVTDDGNLTVSSWGNQYIVIPSDYDSISIGSGEYVKYEAVIFE